MTDPIAELLAKLKAGEWLHHREGCMAGLCYHCYKRWECKPEYHFDHDFKPSGLCECGLDAMLAALVPSSPPEQERECPTCGHAEAGHHHVMTDGQWCSVDGCLCVDCPWCNGTGRVTDAVDAASVKMAAMGHAADCAIFTPRSQSYESDPDAYHRACDCAAPSSPPQPDKP